MPGWDLEERFVWNGLDGIGGQPLRMAVEPEELGRALLSGSQRMDFGGAPKARSRAPGYERWGIVYMPESADSRAAREALEPLVAWRRRRFRGRVGEFELAPAPAPRRGFALVPLEGSRDEVDDPDYLLLVGDPQGLPWEAQYALDQARSVGRLSFSAADDYQRYARSVIACESGRCRRNPSVGLHGPRFRNDRATELSADELLAPLLETLGALPDWQLTSDFGHRATKARLGELLGGGARPALVFAASHGLAFPADHPRQVAQQGALVCAEWPGSGMESSHFFGAEDVTDDLEVEGVVLFAFGCCTAGTPLRGVFAPALGETEPPPMAPGAFVSALSQRLLSHPKGGALGFIGHVDLAWPYSYRLAGGLEVYREALRGLLQGRTVGDALHGFGARHGDILHELSEAMDPGGEPVDPRWLGILWIAARDARSYVLVGDPAVRLAVARRP